MSPGPSRKITGWFVLDARSLAAGRALLGAVLLYDLAVRAASIGDMYTDAGFVPRDLAALVGEPEALSLHALGGGAGFQAALFAAHAALLVAFAAGARTTWSAPLSWLMTVSLHHRNPMLNNFADDGARWVLLWCAFLPTSRVWSVDAAAAAGTARPLRVASLAAVCVHVQVAVLYLVTAALKSDPEWHGGGHGSAIYYALSVDYYARQPVAGLLLALPDEPCLRLLTAATWWWELAGVPVFFLASGLWRAAAAAAFVGLHAGLAAAMHLGIFSPTCCALWVMLLPAAAWDRALAAPVPVRAGPGAGPRLLRALAWGEALLAVRVERAPGGPALELAATKKRDGGGTRDADALAELARRSRRFRAVLVAVAAPLAGDFAAAPANDEAPPPPPARARQPAGRRWLARARLLTLTFLLAHVSLGAMDALGLGYAFSAEEEEEEDGGDDDEHELSPAAFRFASRAGLGWQRWAMFTPGPPRDDGWFVFVGRAADGGDDRDPFRGGAPVSWEEPADRHRSFRNYRWLSYLVRLWTYSTGTEDMYPGVTARRDAAFAALGRRLCAGDAGLGSVETVFVREPTRPPGQPRARPQRWALWKTDCRTGEGGVPPGLLGGLAL